MYKDTIYISTEESVDILEETINQSKEPHKKRIKFALDYLYSIKNACELCGHYLVNLVDGKSQTLDTSVINLSDSYFMYDTSEVVIITCDHIVRETVDQVIENKLEILKMLISNTMLTEFTSELSVVQEIIECVKSCLLKSVIHIKNFKSNSGTTEIYNSITQAKTYFNECETVLDSIINQINTQFISLADLEVH